MLHDFVATSMFFNNFGVMECFGKMGLSLRVVRPGEITSSWESKLAQLKLLQWRKRIVSAMDKLHQTDTISTELAGRVRLRATKAKPRTFHALQTTFQHCPSGLPECPRIFAAAACWSSCRCGRIAQPELSTFVVA